MARPGGKSSDERGVKMTPDRNGFQAQVRDTKQYMDCVVQYSVHQSDISLPSIPTTPLGIVCYAGVGQPWAA